MDVGDLVSYAHTSKAHSKTWVGLIVRKQSEGPFIMNYLVHWLKSDMNDVWYREDELELLVEKKQQNKS